MLSRSEERLLRALQRRKARESQGFFLAEGVRVAEALVRTGIALELAIVSTTLEDTPRGRQLQDALAARVSLRIVPERVVRASAATENPQGVLVVARAPVALLADVRVNTHSRLLVCDAVQDPGNLGTLIRVADAFAAAAVILLPGTVDAWNPKVVRSAAGSSFHLPLVSASVADLSAWLRQHRFLTLGAAPGGAALEPESLPARAALIVGNEGAGLSEETQALVDRMVRIDMPGHAESLNVAVAAGILLYLLARGET
jgi:TrmH family RNA methyltransferase